MPIFDFIIITYQLYGIGAGKYTAGQVLINDDLLCYFDAFVLKFVKKYANLAEIITGAFREYTEEVRSGKFPGPEHAYHVLEEERESFDKVVERYRKGRG
jgi:3-methyl-2-oxobutanoate hydroxymethyltransferase